MPTASDYGAIPRLKDKRTSANGPSRREKIVYPKHTVHFLLAIVLIAGVIFLGWSSDDESVSDPLASVVSSQSVRSSSSYGGTNWPNFNGNGGTNWPNFLNKMGKKHVV